MRSGLRSPCAAPVRLSTSSSISRCAAKPTISRNKSASELFSSRVRRRIISSVIVGSLGSREGLPTKPYRRAAMTTAVDKCPAAARLVAVAAAGHLPTAPTPPPGTRPLWGVDAFRTECHEAHPLKGNSVFSEREALLKCTERFRPDLVQLPG